MDRSTIIGAVILAGFAVFGYGRMLAAGRSGRRLRAFLPAATIVDVRSNEEFKSGHFPGAINIPLEKLAKSGRRLNNKTKPLILYCSAGGRARRGARLLRMMGYSKVLVGGSLGQMEKLVKK